MNPHPLATFLSYSHKNGEQRDKLREHFVQLERGGLIRFWDDRELQVGQEFNVAIGEELELAEVFILLVSQQFIASEYCWGTEMKRALERHEAGTALVLPVIATPCDWQHSPLAKLVVAPTGGKPISEWPNQEAGWANAAVLSRQAIVAFRERSFDRRPSPAYGTPLAPAPRAADPMPVRPPPPGQAAGKVSNGAVAAQVPAAPAVPPQRVDKTELIPIYVDLPGFEVSKVASSADQEETAQVTFESLPPLGAGDPAEPEKTESLNLPTPLPRLTEPMVIATEPPAAPLLVQPVPRLQKTAPSPRDLAPGYWKSPRRSWIQVGMGVLAAVVLTAAATAFVCWSRPDPQPTGSPSTGR
jgi:hypothetical protein